MKRTLEILFVATISLASVRAVEAQPAKVDWQKLLTEVRERFAKSGNATLQQTRIDRAYFELNADDPDQPPFLVFKGLSLRTVHDDEKQMKETLRKELGKVAIPNTKFVVKIDAIAFHATPVYALQAAAVAAHNADPKLNVFFERASFGTDGAFQLHVLFLRDAPADTIAKLYEKKIAGELLKLPDGKTSKAPTVLRRDYDWAATRKDLRSQFAGDADPLLKRTRLDDAFLDFTADHKDVQFHASGVCIDPPGLVDDAKRAKVWKDRMTPRLPTLTIAKAKLTPAVTGIAMLPNPSIAWQNEIAADARHDGVFFQLAQFNALGELKLTVKSPSELHHPSIEKKILEKPLPAKLYLGKAPEFQIWHWEEIAIEGQARLAKGDFVLHRARLDRTFLRYDDPKLGDPYLHIHGVSLHPTGLMPAEKQRARFERELVGLLPADLEQKLNTAQMRFLESPIYALQAEANTHKLDGLLFADARYDKAGKLRFVVAGTSDAQRKRAQQLIDAAKLGEGVTSPRDAKTLPIDFLLIAWGEFFDEMQRWLARDSDTLFRKTRVDRGFFSYPANRIGPDLNLATVGIYPKNDAYNVRLKKRLDQFVDLYLTDQLKAGPVSSALIVQNVENPAPIIQAKIAETPALDGARIDDASFDATGKLAFHGIWIDKTQVKPSEKLIHATLTPDHPALQRGIHWGAMQNFDSPALLMQMCTWIANQDAIEETWIERLYFDAAGKIRVAGFATRPQDKQAAVQRLREFLPTFESQKLPSIDGPGEKKKVGQILQPDDAIAFVRLESLTYEQPKDAGPIAFDILPNIAKYLRNSIPKVAACDGLRIDRCFYGPTGVFRIDGLADHAKQISELKQFIDDAKVPFDRKRQLARGWGDGRQTVIPLRPMQVSLDENLPSLPEFDGVTLRRAYHDPKNQLVLTGSAIGDADPKVMTPILKRLLETHPRWELRTTAGVVVNITDRKKPNRDLATRNVMSALHLLQVNIGEAYVEPGYPQPRSGWWSHAWPFDERLPRVRPTDADYDRCLEHLDAALLNDPQDTLARYLRGYCLQTKRRPDLTLRDFRRMAAEEIDEEELRHKRILALELVQGVFRQSAFRIEQNAIVEVSDGWTLRELRESPAVPTK